MIWEMENKVGAGCGLKRCVRREGKGREQEAVGMEER